jgi:16S rRNA (adenine1518-N6/adenine1519-N6)-dimethyltransferase
MFFHRRKFLRSELISVCQGRLTKADVDAVLAEQRLAPSCRAEELDVDCLLTLCEAVRRRLPQLD